MALVILAFAAAPPLHAGNCSWQSAPTALNFAAYSIFAPADDTATSSFTIRCTPNTHGRIIITPVSLPWRTLVSGGNTANYNLYLDAGGAQVWGDTTFGYSYDRYAGTSGQKEFTDSIFGIVPAGQNLAPGTYTATVNVQLSQSNNLIGPWTAVSPTAGYPVTVTLVVSAECRVDTFAISFGNYNPFSATALSQSTVVKVYCTAGTAASATLDSGLFPNGAQRRMSNLAGGFLNYDAVYTGSTGGTSTSSIVPIASGFPLAGSVPPSQDVPIGSYIDTLQAVVNY